MKIVRNRTNRRIFIEVGRDGGNYWDEVLGETKAALIPVLDLMAGNPYETWCTYDLTKEEFKAITEGCDAG